MMAIVGFLPATDPRTLATISAIEEDTEFCAVVGLDSLHMEGQSGQGVVDEGDGGFLVAAGGWRVMERQRRKSWIALMVSRGKNGAKCHRPGRRGFASLARP